MKCSVQERFNRKVNKGEECWLWGGSLTRGGYGQFRWRSKKTGKWTMGRAHRVSYMLYKGDIPDGSFILHSCDTPACVNPDHLSLGTCQDNTDDKLKKGRHKWGNKGKINLAIAEEIRITEGTNVFVAEQFGISPTEVSYIKNNKRWRKSAGGL